MQHILSSTSFKSWRHTNQFVMLMMTDNKYVMSISSYMCVYACVCMHVCIYEYMYIDQHKGNTATLHIILFVLMKLEDVIPVYQDEDHQDYWPWNELTHI